MKNTELLNSFLKLSKSSIDEKGIYPHQVFFKSIKNEKEEVTVAVMDLPPNYNIKTYLSLN